MPPWAFQGDSWNRNKGNSRNMSLEYPNNYLYNTHHVWAKLEQKKNKKQTQPQTFAYVGITDYLAEELGGIDSIDIPLEEDELEMDSLVIHIHTKSRIRHFPCPLTGRVVEVNQEVLDSPAQIYLDWENAWLFKMEVDNTSETDLLMDGKQYVKYLDSL
jgi:glycine cleavage system H protein